MRRMGEMRNAYKILVGKSEWGTLLWRPRHRCKDNIRMNLREIGWEIVDWMHLAQNRDQWRAYVNLRVPYMAGNLLTRWVTINFSGRTLLHGVKLAS
jgi:hypothetical protein